MLASPHGTIELLKPVNADTREFLLDVTESGSRRLRWILKAVDSGTELSVVRQRSVGWLPNLGQRVAVADHELERKLGLLPKALNLKLVVLGGGTGLYTTLLGLRDRSWSLTAVIAGRTRRGSPRDPKDELGLLPRDDASMCLVALAPAAEDTMVLRSLLEHSMKEGRWQGTHVGPVLLDALAEIRGSRQSALDAAAKLLGMRGRIVVAQDGTGEAATASHSARDAAVDAIMDADMVVLAPGRLEADIASVLSVPSIIEAMQKTAAVKVVVTKIMTSEGDRTDEPTTSHQLKAIAAAAPVSFDVILANSASFTKAQLQAYAAVGAHPVVPDWELTAGYARLVITERLVAAGHLARHDPKELGEALIAVGTDSFLSAQPAGVQTLAG